MNRATFLGLVRGDLVRMSEGGRIFVVTGNFGNRVTAVASVDLTNPEEWEKIPKEAKIQGADNIKRYISGYHRKCIYCGTIDFIRNP